MPGKPKFELDPIKAAEAAKSLIESIRAMAGDEDDELIADMVEGETDLMDVLDALVERRNLNKALAEGIDLAVADLGLRKARFLKRVETDKALIEQAMTIAGLPSIERPCGTLVLTQRAPVTVVDNEADIPAEFWKAGDPKLDKKALNAAVAERQAERERRLAEWREQHGEDAPPPNDLPSPIPGAHLEASPASLTVRVR